VRRGGARRALQALRAHRQHQERRRRQSQPGLRRVRKSFPRPSTIPSSGPYPIDPHRDPVQNSGRARRSSTVLHVHEIDTMGSLVVGESLDLARFNLCDVCNFMRSLIVGESQDLARFGP